MTDVVALLREAATLIGPPLPDEPTDTAKRLTAAADELEASAEWALCKWLAEDKHRMVRFFEPSLHPWICELYAVIGDDPDASGYGTDRADAIRAALKAWEER